MQNTEYILLAERVRFELTEPVKAQQFSRLSLSTAQPPLHKSGEYRIRTYEPPYGSTV